MDMMLLNANINVLSINEDMSINDLFHEKICENNTMEESSEVEEPTIFEDATEALLLQLAWLFSLTNSFV